jgi:hypothetical protein
MKRTILILLLFFCKPLLSQYQDTMYTVELAATFSPIISFYEHPRYAGATENATLGYGTTVRAMWFPARMLSIGIMSGYLFISEDKISTVKGSNLTTEASAKLTAIPLQVIVSMQNYNIEFGLGMGPYLMMTEINYGTRATGKRLELGLMGYGSYVFKIWDRFCIGPEVRVLYFSYRGILSIMPSISIHFDAFRY